MGASRAGPGSSGRPVAVSDQSAPGSAAPPCQPRRTWPLDRRRCDVGGTNGTRENAASAWPASRAAPRCSRVRLGAREPVSGFRRRFRQEAKEPAPNAVLGRFLVSAERSRSALLAGLASRDATTGRAPFGTPFVALRVGWALLLAAGLQGLLGRPHARWGSTPLASFRASAVAIWPPGQPRKPPSLCIQPATMHKMYNLSVESQKLVRPIRRGEQRSSERHRERPAPFRKVAGSGSAEAPFAAAAEDLPGLPEPRSGRRGGGTACSRPALTRAVSGPQPARVESACSGAARSARPGSRQRFCLPVGIWGAGPSKPWSLHSLTRSACGVASQVFQLSSKSG